MPEIVFRDGDHVRYEAGDTVRFTEEVKEGGPTGCIYELCVYINGKKSVGQWDAPANTPITGYALERGEFVYAPPEPIQIRSAYDLAGPGMSPIDILMLKQVTYSLPPNAVCVNIGANIGTSTIALLEDRPDVFIFSIDVKPWQDEFDNLRQVGLYNLHRVVRILGRSQEVGMNWPYPIDFLFVDGAHKYVDVVEDIQVWVPKVKSGGVVAFHDYGMRHTPGVVKAVDELMADYEVIVQAGVLKVFRV